MITGHRAITDEEGYYYCKEYIPEIAGTYKGTALIVGGGKDMWDDKARFDSFGVQHDIIAVNVAGLVLPKVDHLFSLHFHQITAISKFRKAEYCGDKHIVHSQKPIQGVDYVWKISGMTSTSGFVAIWLAKLLGYEKYILCGVPMDGSGYFYKPSINKTFEDDFRGKEIQSVKNVFGDNVRSMSGRTKDILGYPDDKWLKGE